MLRLSLTAVMENHSKYENSQAKWLLQNLMECKASTQPPQDLFHYKSCGFNVALPPTHNNDISHRRLENKGPASSASLPEPMCARNIKPENERWVLGMESRLASQTMPDGGSSRLAELLEERRRRRKRRFALWRWKTASLRSFGCFASRLCRNESCLLPSALRPHTHSHLVQPQHHGSCALPPARDVRGGAAGDAQLHN